jgi:thioredoxin-like negative regulator of GroEL
MTALPVERHDEILGTGLNVLVFRVADSPACQRFQPELDALAARRPDVAVWTVEAMQERALAERHGLRALPSIVIYRDGLPCRRYAGSQQADELEAAIDEVAAADMGAEYQDWMIWMLENGEAGSPHLGSASPDGDPGLAGGPTPSRTAPSQGSPVKAFGALAGTPLRSTVTQPAVQTRAATPAHADSPAPANRPAGTTATTHAGATIGPPAGLVRVRAHQAPRPGAPGDPAADPEELHEQADRAWYGGDLATAIRLFTLLLQRDPSSWAVRNARGQVLADSGGGALALADLDAVMAQHGDGAFAAYARSARALALAQVGRHDEADADLADALAVTPDNGWAHLRAARIHQLRGHREPMAAALRRALDGREPGLTDAQRSLAESLLLLA